jgi:tRNA/rRNA methyltransferase
MNLGQAVAICLYELMRDSGSRDRVAIRGSEVTKRIQPASAEEFERITDTLLEALRASEYPKLNTSKSFHAAVRRLVRRLNLQQGDAEFFLGMLRQMVWKMKRDGQSGKSG